VSNLIAEAEAAAVSFAELAEQGLAQALDPLRSSEEVASARHEMDAAAFSGDRMREAAHRLRERLRVVRQREDQARRRVAYDAAVAERDALAAELAELYPAVAERLADMASRIAASDAVIDRINRALPDGAKWLPSAEMVARNLYGFNDGTATVPRITEQMRLPAFCYDRHDPYAWPTNGHRAIAKP
jgi:chromosome segregation ATPase